MHQKVLGRKIELTAGSDKKHCIPGGGSNPGVFWISSDLAVSSSIFVGEKGGNLIRNDRDKIELSITW